MSYNKINICQQYQMSTEQIYKDQSDRYHSLQRDYSAQKFQKTKFKIKRRIGQLENKACFFQGQLNPMTVQNKSLREKLIQLSRAVSASSDLLRNLLPVDNNPTRKLKLQIASLQQISAMIKQDWLEMKESIRCMTDEINRKNMLIQQLEQRYCLAVTKYETIILNDRIKYESQIKQLKSKKEELEVKIQQMISNHKLEKQQLVSFYNGRLQEGQRLRKQFQSYIKQMNEKCANYQRVAQRLRDQIAHNLQQFQKSKLNLKQIYQNLMQSKLDQQSQEFQFMLKLKQQQKMKLIEEMNFQTEELKKKISQKNSEINYLSGINDKLKQQIGAAKDEVWSHKLKLDACHKQLKQISQKLYNEQESNKSLRAKIQQNEQKILKIEQNLKKTKDSYEKQLQNEKIRMQQLQKKIEQQKEMFEKKIAQSDLKIQQFKRKLRQNDEKFQERLDEQRRKYQQKMLKYQQDEKLLKQAIEKAEQKIKSKEEQINSIIKRYDTQMQKIERMNQQKLEKLLSDHKYQLNKIISSNEQQIKMMKKQHARMLSEIEISNNQYIKKLISQNNMKLHEEQMKYKNLQQTSQQQLKLLQSQLNQANTQNKILKGQVEQVTENFKRAVEQHRKILEQQRRQSEQRLQMEKKKMMNQLQEQIQLFRRTMQQKQANFKNQLSQMQQSMQKQINMLRQTNAIQSVQQKYNNIIAKMKEEMENQLKKLQHEHHEQLIMLSKKLQFDVSKLNQQLLSQKQAHQFSRLSRQQKINYLVNKITEYRNQMANKDNQILQLQFQIQRKNKQLQKIDEIVEEKVKKIKMEFNQEILQIRAECAVQIKKNESQCQRKIKKVETERIEFTQLIYNQFQELKLKYDNEMRRLQRKYDELEKVFEERPSRAEDLSKIKQLIEQKSKMDLQIKQCKKKVKQANQIVKYLNLELSNYKQTYDIFGPGGEPLSPERRNYTQIDSPIRSLIKRQTTPYVSEDSSRGQRQKRMMTQSPDINVNQFKLFPSINRNMSEAVEQQEDESQQSQRKIKMESNLRRKPGERMMFSNKIEHEDKSEELKSNASIFMGLLNKQQRLPTQVNKSSYGYTKRLSRRKTIAVSFDKKLQIKDKTIVFEP